MLIRVLTFAYLSVMTVLVAGILFLIVSMLLPTVAPAADEPTLTNELVQKAFETAKAFKKVERVPPVRLALASKAQLLEFCRCNQLGIQGLYVRSKIYLLDSLDFTTPEGQGVLLHEMVHHMQWALAGEAKDCQESVDREVEAYAFERRFLLSRGVIKSLYVMPICI